MVRGAEAAMPTLDLIVFPEYSLNALDPHSWANVVRPGRPGD